MRFEPADLLLGVEFEPDALDQVKLGSDWLVADGPTQASQVPEGWESPERSRPFQISEAWQRCDHA